MTKNEQALLALAMSGLDSRSAAIADCRVALGRALITTPEERANVAAELAARGYDGLGRMALAHADLSAAAKADTGLLDCVAGR